MGIVNRAQRNQKTRTEDAKQVINAIENDEYCLFSQLIAPIAIDSHEFKHYEILVRLIENKKNIMLPGEFFPLAETCGHMLHLDRWVVEHATDWISRQYSLDGKYKNSIFFINLSDDSINDPGFPEFLKTTLLKHGVSGAVLGFEIPAAGLNLRSSEITQFVQQVKKCGCHISISGFGQDQVLFDRIQGFGIDFLKIDCSITLNILDNPADFAAVKSIVNTAKEFSIKTVVELVENDETIAKLREIGIDFAQGYGISTPRPLAD